ncbi:MAG: penicillin-binding protein 2 [Candidatus Omnitrophica bacterium]|nr:penicillin-binding protein 2 [Candidatus Omnitrophota bacterium]
MRDRFLITTLSLLFILIIAGLFFNQVLLSGYYSKLSRNNSIRVIPISGTRGNIFDRTGRPLVTNRLSFDVAIIFQEIGDRRKLVNLLKRELGFSGAQIMSALEKAGNRPYEPVTIAEDIDKEKALALEESSFDVSGLIIETRSRRNYLYKHFGCHIFGYLGEVTANELETLKDYGYRMKDLIGRDGLEKYYESYLRGADGGIQVEVDSRGHQTRILGLKEPQSGQNLQLTIDMSLQLVCDKLLGDHKGAILVMDPRNGEILALASHPTFDPNTFVRSGTSQNRLKLLNDKVGRPMSNKAISGIYSPGSVFKIVTASAALEQKKITPYTRFFCSGSYNLGHTQFDCWKKGGHGPQNIVEGIMNSCNVFFYNTGRALGVDRLELYTRFFGYGKATGIDLTDEVKGIVPGKGWKRSHKKGAWYEGETLNYAIGQGYLSVTPIQVLNMISAIANNGNLVRPHLVRRVGANDLQNQKPKKIGLKDGTIREVRKGLFEAVNNESGTAKRSKPAGTIAAGKTGTAQNPQGRTHAWFCGFAPYNDPKLCLVVFLEHGGKGGLEPAEIARGLFEEARAGGYL